MLQTMKGDTTRSAQVLQRLYDSHLGKFVSANDLPLSRFLQWMVLPTIWFLDEELHDTLSEHEPTFCAPWILTWFSNLEEPRLFDAFIAAHPLLPFYCSMVLVLEHKTEIQHDAMTVHKPLPVEDSEKLLTESLNLMGRVPPHKLWVIASHYHGDGEVKELLRQGPEADALLTLAASERPPLVPASPLSQLAIGLGLPSKTRRRRRRQRILVLGILLCGALWAMARRYCMITTTSPTATQTVEQTCPYRKLPFATRNPVCPKRKNR